jgi:hypothetical protein
MTNTTLTKSKTVALHAKLHTELSGVEKGGGDKYIIKIIVGDS